MFDFEKLTVYIKARTYNLEMNNFLKAASISKVQENQIRRASFSIMLNIAEGAGRFTKPDRRNFYVIARGSVFECVAAIDFLKHANELTEKDYIKFYSQLEELSKMLYSLIKGLQK